MKANELMIGDWVKVLPISKRVTSHYSKVGALTRNVDNSISIEGGHFPSWTGWSVSEEHIEPIPLTEDIVRANCAEKSLYDELYLFKQISPVYMDCFYDFCTKLFHIHGVNCGLCCDGKFNYVHELQHALRLCGLNELADNFKIE